MIFTASKFSKAPPRAGFFMPTAPSKDIPQAHRNKPPARQAEHLGSELIFFARNVKQPPPIQSISPDTSFFEKMRKQRGPTTCGAFIFNILWMAQERSTKEFLDYQQKADRCKRRQLVGYAVQSFFLRSKHK